MSRFIFLISIFLCSTSCFGQYSVANLQKSHAIALEEFLSKNKDYGFLSSKVISSDNMKFIRETFGKRFEPYYQVADFNNDRILDFAIVLSRKGEPKENEGITGDYQYDHPLSIVIFNGQKKGNFRKAFIEDIEAPLLCFLNVDGTKKKELYFGVFESDADTRIFTPVGKGYIIEYRDEP